MMLLYQNDAEILFPSRLIPSMRELRGELFRLLIDRLSTHSSSGHFEILGFTLMMIRLSNCLTCTADSHRAMQGCTFCSHRVIRNFGGTDEDLIQLWETACAEIRLWQDGGIKPQD